MKKISRRRFEGTSAGIVAVMKQTPVGLVG